jgi:Zn-dependent protease/CBS domain-containing protein
MPGAVYPAAHLRRTFPAMATASSPPVPPRPATAAPAGIRLGRFLGVEVRLDYSWFILLFVILGTLAGALFPAYAPEVSYLGHLAMGVVGAFLFFASLLLHELGHAITARRRGIEVEGITLFIFGGMARTRREAERPLDEFLVAAMGPVVSFLLAAGFYAAGAVGRSQGLGPEFTVTLETLGYLNLLLAIFNLLPGFPLDGGRILRAVLWMFTGSLRRATQAAAAFGRLLGWAIILVGIWSLLSVGAFVAGLWMVFIGWFLNQTARASYQHVLLQELLGPLTARQAMSPDPETVGPDVPVDALVHDYFLRRPYNAFPVVQDDVLVGMVTLNGLQDLPREAWEGKVAAHVMVPLEKLVLVDPETPMVQVLEQMQNSESRRVLVARDWELMGIISASDIARWLDRVALMD